MARIKIILPASTYCYTDGGNTLLRIHCQAEPNLVRCISHSINRVYLNTKTNCRHNRHHDESRRNYTLVKPLHSREGSSSTSIEIYMLLLSLQALMTMKSSAFRASLDTASFFACCFALIGLGAAADRSFGG